MGDSRPGDDCDPGKWRSRPWGVRRSFRGCPDYGRTWAEVFRWNWWHHWRDYAEVDLDPRGDWRSAFDNWRRLATGYRPESGGSTAKRSVQNEFAEADD